MSVSKKPETLKDVIEEPVTCPNCSGKGEVLVQSIAGTNHDGIIPCPMCGGQGKTKTKEVASV